MSDIYVARQPVYTRDLRLFGYELLFRAGDDEEHANVIDDDRATSLVILNTFTVIGLENLVGKHRAFINVGHGFLVSQERVPLPPNRVVLEVLENTEPDEPLLAALDRLQDAGYTIALDDFIPRPGLEPLIERAAIVKLEVWERSLDELAHLVRQLKSQGVRLLAEKVETRQRFRECLELGFDYFQGYFLHRPDTVRGSAVPTHRSTTIRLLSLLNEQDADPAQLEQIISNDISLSYRLLRYLDSPLFPTQHRIESIHQAILYLGIRELRTWATLMALASMEDTPAELLNTVAVRARMCQLLGEDLGQADPRMLFTVGLFSGLEGLMDTSMESIVADLPLSDEVKDALLYRAGPAGFALECVLRYESGDWEWLERTELERARLVDAYLEAIEWARVTLAVL